MVKDFGVDKLTARNIRDIARVYREKFLRIKRIRKFGPFSEELETIDEQRQALDEKIQRLKKKAHAVIKEFLKRLNLDLALTLSETEDDVRILTNCPTCSQQVNLLHCVVFENEKLGLRCYKCGAERWMIGG